MSYNNQSQNDFSNAGNSYQEWVKFKRSYKIASSSYSNLVFCSLLSILLFLNINLESIGELNSDSDILFVLKVEYSYYCQ